MSNQNINRMHDIIIIGAGPAGYVAAIRAAQAGLNVALIEKHALGGTCLNWGCIPTKSLLKSAETWRTVTHASKYGVQIENATINLPQMMQRARDVIAQLNRGLHSLMKKNKITVYEGQGALKYAAPIGQKHQVDIQNLSSKQHNVTIEAEHVILANGARSRMLPMFEPYALDIWLAADAMSATTLPKSLMIVGGGAIGLEFASFYHTLGTHVTLIERQSRLLQTEDEDISTAMHRFLTQQGMQIHVDAEITELHRHDETKEFYGSFTSKQHNEISTSFNVERILLAVGVQENIENLGLECAPRIKIEKNHIQVNAWGQTDHEGIYAIGDVAGGPWLAHKASAQAVACIDHILKRNRPSVNLKHIPGCIYSLPGVASIGLTEQSAHALKIPIKVGTVPISGNGKALANGLSDGFVKTIFHADTGQFLGMHLIGDGVTELISLGSLALQMEAVEEDFMHTIFPHPTLSELIQESTLAAFGQVIHG